MVYFSVKHPCLYNKIIYLIVANSNVNFYLFTEFDLHFPAFGRNSFLEHKSISFNLEENRIDLTFRTSVSDGLLLFAADSKDRGDFIQLRVVGGNLEFRFDPGDSLVYIQSNERVDTGDIVTATAT